MKTPTEEKKDLMEELREQRMWGNIHRLAEQDPALQELLDKVVVYYKLKYKR